MPAPSPGKKGKARAEGIPSPAPPRSSRRGAGRGGAASALLRPRTGLRGESRRWQKERWEDSGEGWPGTARHRCGAALPGAAGAMGTGRGGPAGEGVCGVAVIPR